jgi:type IV pilus assembly protein PilV
MATQTLSSALRSHARHPRTSSRSRWLPQRARGFTLVEALIALLVLSIGLLGVAALQLSSLQANSGAFQRSQATFLAQDFVDRMRANRARALTGAYDFPYGTAAPATPTTTADIDIAEWKARLAATLPAASSGNPDDDPDASVAIDVATEVVTITIRWDDTRGADDLLVYTMRTRV